MKQSDNLKILLSELRPHYSTAGVADAILAAQGDPAARNRIAYAYSLFALGIAFDYAYRYRYDSDDCVSVALLGLVEGMNAYPVEKALPPAVVYRRYITNAFYEHVSELRKGTDRRALQFMRAVRDGHSLEELSKYAEDRLLFSNMTYVSTEDFVPGSDKLTIAETIPSDDSPSISEDCKKLVSKLLYFLSPFEREVVSRYYGIGCTQESFETIGFLFNKTCEACRLAHRRSLEKLQSLSGGRIHSEVMNVISD